MTDEQESRKLIVNGVVWHVELEPKVETSVQRVVRFRSGLGQTIRRKVPSTMTTSQLIQMPESEVVELLRKAPGRA